MKRIDDIVVHGYRTQLFNIWGSWGKWSMCTKTCGGGTSSRYRYCHNPTPLKCAHSAHASRARWHGERRVCGTKDCPEGIWFGIIGGLAGVFVLGLIGVLYRGMEFKIVQRRPQYSISETWNTNFGYTSDEQNANTEC